MSKSVKTEMKKTEDEQEKTEVLEEKKPAAKKAKHAAAQESPAEDKKDGVEIVEKEEEEEDGVYKAKLKPKLSDDEKDALSKRSAKNKQRPKFKRQEWYRYKKLGEKWRKPRGLHSKYRMHWKYRPALVSIGYRGPQAVRGRHPSGFEEVLVYNVKDLDGMEPARQAARIGHAVGTRKRVEIQKKADELGIRVLNRGA